MAQPQQQNSSQNKDASAARKRRRRAPAGGAADDCFSCAKKNLKCDRSRPYCSQCLETGQECSGYKTQLTWGVGVASRGKLRGLSLPVAKSAPVTGGTQKKSPPASALYHCDYLTVSSPDNLSSSPAIQGHWDQMQFPGTLSIPEDHDYQKMNAHLGSLAMTPDQRLSPSLDSTSDGYLSPMAHSFSRVDEVPYVHSPNVMYDGCTNQSSPVARSPLPIVMMDQSLPTSCPSLVYDTSDHSSSFPPHTDSFEAQLSRRLMRECDNLSKANMISDLGPCHFQSLSSNDPNTMAFQAYQNSTHSVQAAARQQAQFGHHAHHGHSRHVLHPQQHSQIGRTVPRHEPLVVGHHPYTNHAMYM
ncbi:unnamed protein product [Parascedosporium putredinis]|uniref:Zn(2)-C6 fungal-type domain-containing protein n=1 Tax=Parascedosporium putredinis TaxID=1442378 RepID=A0A9P1MA34_9PEZI|nr:unnamed protein product [Parascedosporium putredinis]CAI7993198.1 unnamed protein product [Parascedosporium putredinis]